jgi:mannose-6-phosphate isomerase-like protein (cupin superfamily)
VIVYDLSSNAVRNMARVDLATVGEEPQSPIGHFDFHDCLCGIGSFIGQPPWELHTAGDELLHILDGESDLIVLEGEQERECTLRAGDLVIVPQGCWHSNNAPHGVTMLYLTPRQGNRHSWGYPADRQGTED